MDKSSKLWLQSSLNALAINRAKMVMEQAGVCLPCKVVAVNGAVVTVQFLTKSDPFVLPNVTIPKAESGWIRNPTQVGDLGITIAADVYIGSISGLGNGETDFTEPGNLSSLVFLPISSKNSPPIDPNAAQIQGVNGVISRTTNGTTSQVVTNTSGTTITYGANSLTVNGSTVSGNVGGSSLSITSSAINISAGGQTFSVSASGVIINGINFGTHVHYVPVAPGYSNGPQ